MVFGGRGAQTHTFYQIIGRHGILGSDEHLKFDQSEHQGFKWQLAVKAPINSKVCIFHMSSSRLFSRYFPEVKDIWGGDVSDNNQELSSS